MTETFTLNPDYNLQRIASFRTIIQDLGNGYEQRISKSDANGLRRYKFVFDNRLTTDMQTDLYDFYVARKGRFDAFNITDLFDSSTVLCRFEEDDLTETMFFLLLERSDLTIRQVKN